MVFPQRVNILFGHLRRTLSGWFSRFLLLAAGIGLVATERVKEKPDGAHISQRYGHVSQ